MRSVNDVYGANLLSSSKEPRVTVGLSFDLANTNVLWMTSHYDAETPAVPSDDTIIDCIGGVSTRTQRVDLRQGKSSIGSLSIRIADLNSDFSDRIYAEDIAGNGVRHKRVIVYEGFQGMTWADYVVAYTFIVDDLILNEDGSYTLEAKDIQRSTHGTLFELKNTTLTSSIADDLMLLPHTGVTPISDFEPMEHDANYSHRPSTTVRYVKIEEEIICVDTDNSHVDGTLGPCFVVLDRGALGTVAKPHTVDGTKSIDKRLKIEEVVFLEGAALMLLYEITTGEKYNSAASLPSGWGMGIDEAFINLDSFKEVGKELWDPTTGAGKQLRFIGVKNEDGKNFIERQILYWLGGALIVEESGALRFKRSVPILEDAAYVMELNNNNIGERKAKVRKKEQDVVNVINIDWNFSHIKKEYTKTNTLIDNESRTKHQKARPLDIQLRGVHLSANTDNDVRNHFNTLRDRFANPPYEIRGLPIHPSTGLLQVLDPVRLKTNKIKDPVGGGTFDRTAEISSISRNILEGDVTVDLFCSSGRASALPDQPSASTVMDDDWYDSVGTELSTVLTISADTVQANGSLTGASTIDGAVYYYLGNLTIPSGITVDWDNNIFLKVRGTLTIEGTFGKVGGGIAGVVQSWAEADGNQPPSLGYLGYGLAGSGIAMSKVLGDSTKHFVKDLFFITNGIATSYGPVKAGPPFNWDLSSGAATVPNNIVEALTFFPLVNIDGSSLTGYPPSLLGSPGGAGLPAYGGSDPGDESVTAREVRRGGAGGNGGIGGLIVSRGASISPSGDIITSGGDASQGDLITRQTGDYRSGTGAPGFPGGIGWLIDGNATPPDLAANHTADTGDATFTGTADHPWLGGIVDIITGPRIANEGGQGAAVSKAVSTSLVQYIPPPLDAGEDQDDSTNIIQLDPIGGSPVALTGDSTILEHEDGTVTERIRFDWTASVQTSHATGYETQIKRTSDPATEWQTANVIHDLANSFGYFDAIAGVAYDWRVRVIGSPNYPSTWNTVVVTTAIGKSTPPDDVTGFKVVGFGELANLGWDLVSNSDRDGYITKFGPSGVIWEDAIFLSKEDRGTKGTTGHVPPGVWDFLVKARNRSGVESTNATRVSDVVISNFNDVILQVNHHPIWSGFTLTNMGIHYTGKLYPKSDDVASDYGDEMWDDFVPNPFSTYRAEAPEQDQGVDSISRLWADFSGALGVGETGQLDLQLQVDYRKEADSYDGFENWVSGQVEMRRAKFRIDMASVVGALGYISTFQTTIDAKEKTEVVLNKTISIGSTTITFVEDFVNTPTVGRYTIQGTTVLNPVFENMDKDSVDVTLKNSSDSDVGGVFVEITFVGV